MTFSTLGGPLRVILHRYIKTIVSRDRNYEELRINKYLLEDQNEELIQKSLEPCSLFIQRVVLLN